MISINLTVTRKRTEIREDTEKDLVLCSASKYTVVLDANNHVIEDDYL